MGMAGGAASLLRDHLDPASGFNLAYAVNAIAMPMIGGMTWWLGPVIGAVLPRRQRAGRDGDDFVDPQSADRRLAADGIRDFRAQRHGWPVERRKRATRDERDPAPGRATRQALRRLRRANDESISTCAKASGSASSVRTASGKSTLVNCISARCGTRRPGAFRRRDVNGAARLYAPRPARHRRSFQLPRPFRSHDAGAESSRIPLLYTVNARAGKHLSRQITPARPNSAARGARRQGRHAGRAT